MQTPYHKLTEDVLTAAKEVHQTLGGGFLEKTYEEALYHELAMRGIPSEQQYNIDIIYKGSILKKKYIPDLYVDGKILVEIKAVRDITIIEEAQLMNYLQIANLQVGLLLNFGTKLSVKRRILHHKVQGTPASGEAKEE